MSGAVLLSLVCLLYPLFLGILQLLTRLRRVRGKGDWPDSMEMPSNTHFDIDGWIGGTGINANPFLLFMRGYELTTTIIDDVFLSSYDR